MRLSLSIVIALCASLIQAYPSATKASRAAEDTVLTPGGALPASQVHQVPAGATVQHTSNSIQLLAKNGTVLHTIPQSNAPRKATATTSGPEPIASGWISYASWYNTLGSPISYFYTDWTVPPVPATNHGQTLFLFNSIEPAAGNAILQPVLQYGGSAAGGGAYWAAATWYVGTNGAFYTPLVQVSPGQDLQGAITYVSGSGSSFTYLSGFTNVAGAQGLQVSNSAELVWATETLEVYGVQATSDFPTGRTAFTNINLHTLASTSPSVSWATTSDSADGVSTVVGKDGSVGATIYIVY